VNPDDDDAAKTRDTVGFHCKEVISLSLVDRGPGGMGALLGEFRSWMKSYQCQNMYSAWAIILASAFVAPVSMRFFWMGLKSRPLTGPVCLSLLKILASSALIAGQQLRDALHQLHLPGTSQDLRGVENVDFSSFHTSSQDSSRMGCSR
jgi:hypothetical protein